MTFDKYSNYRNGHSTSVSPPFSPSPAPKISPMSSPSKSQSSVSSSPPSRRRSRSRNGNSSPVSSPRFHKDKSTLLSRFFDQHQQRQSMGDDTLSIGETILTEDLERNGLQRVIEFQTGGPSPTSPSHSVSPRSSPRGGRRPYHPRIGSCTNHNANAASGNSRPSLADHEQLSVLSLGNESYIMDLASQQQRRDEERQQEALEDALEKVNAYVMRLDPSRRPKQDSEEYAMLFLKVLSQTKEKIKHKYQEYDRMVDSKLEEAIQDELERRNNKRRQRQPNGISDSSHHRDFDSHHQPSTIGLEDIDEDQSASVSTDEAQEDDVCDENKEDGDCDCCSQCSSGSRRIQNKALTASTMKTNQSNVKVSSSDGHTDATHYTTITVNSDETLAEEEKVVEEEAIDPNADHNAATDDQEQGEIMGGKFEGKIEFVGDVVDISLAVESNDPGAKKDDVLKTVDVASNQTGIKRTDPPYILSSSPKQNVTLWVISPQRTTMPSERHNPSIADVSKSKNYLGLIMSPSVNTLRSPTTRSPSSKLAARIKMFDSPKLDFDVTPSPARAKMVWKKTPKKSMDLEEDHTFSHTGDNDSPTPRSLEAKNNCTMDEPDPNVLSVTESNHDAQANSTECEVPSVQNRSERRIASNLPTPAEILSPVGTYDASTLRKKLSKVKKMIEKCIDEKEREKLKKKQRTYEDCFDALNRSNTGKLAQPRSFLSPLAATSMPSLVAQVDKPPFDDFQEREEANLNGEKPINSFSADESRHQLQESKSKEQSVPVSPSSSTRPVKKDVLSSQTDVRNEPKPCEKYLIEQNDATDESHCPTSTVEFTLADFERGLVEGVDLSEWEKFLTGTEFERHFGMSKDDFAKQPKWKRERQKRRIRVNF